MKRANRAALALLLVFSLMLISPVEAMASLEVPACDVVQIQEGEPGDGDNAKPDVLREATPAEDLVFDRRPQGWFVVGYTGQDDAVVLPPTVTIDEQETAIVGVGKQASTSWGYITSLTLSSSVTIIDDEAFSGCSTLAALTLPDDSGLATIGARFLAGTAVSEFVMPAALTELDRLAFEGCTALKTLQLSANLPASILDDEASGDDVRYVNPIQGVSGITLVVPSEARNYSSGESGELLSKDGSVLYAYPAAEGEYSVPNGVNAIAQRAFSDNGSLKSVKLADSISAIDDYAFSNTGLTSVLVPASVRFIGSYAFSDCAALTDVSGEGLSGLSSSNATHQFSSCRALASISLPSGISLIPEGCFAGCAVTSLAIPDSLSSIGVSAFDGASSLSRVTGAAGLVRIEKRAFAQTALSAFPFASAESDSKLRYVDGEAFSGCSPGVALPAYLDLQAGNYYGYAARVTLEGREDYVRAFELLRLINEYRANAGASALVMDEELLGAAMQRCSELPVRYASTRPSGLANYTVSSKLGPSCEIRYYAGISASKVFEKMESSDSAKALLKNEGNKSAGIGCFMHNGQYYWVGLFSAEGSSGAAPVRSNATKAHDIGLLAQGNYLPSFSIDGGGATQNVGDTLMLKPSLQSTGLNPPYTAVPEISEKTFQFESIYPDVATVESATGEVTFLKEGEAIIQAKLLGTTKQAIYSFDVGRIELTPSNTEISGLNSKTFNGSVLTPTVKVALNGVTLASSNYTVTYTNSKGIEVAANALKSAGTYTVSVTGQGQYRGTVCKSYTIAKAKQPMTIKAKASVKKLAAKALKSKAKTFATVTVKKNKGAVTYTNASAAGSKAATFKLNPSTGKITVPKKTKAGSYKVKVRATAAGSANYKKGSVAVTFSVKVS